jgi:hypothetical protein
MVTLPVKAFLSKSSLKRHFLLHYSVGVNRAVQQTISCFQQIVHVEQGHSTPCQSVPVSDKPYTMLSNQDGVASLIHN